MKRLQRTVLAFAIVIYMMTYGIACASNVAALSDLTVEYEAAENRLVVFGETGVGASSLLNVVIAPYGTEALSEQSLSENEDVMIKTVQSDIQDKVDVSIIFPESIRLSRYRYHLFTRNSARTGIFFIMSKDVLNRLVDDVNRSDDLKKTLADSVLADNVKVDFEFVAAYLTSEKPNGGYDTETFMKNYMTAEGLDRVKRGDITPNEYFMEYTSYLGTSYYKDFESQPERIQKSAAMVLQNISGITDISKIFDDTMFAANCINCNSAIELQALALPYFEKENLSLTKYNEISNALYREAVFDEMYRRRNEIKQAETVYKLFEEAVNTQISKEAAATNRTSGGGSGGSAPLVGTVTEQRLPSVKQDVVNTQPISTDEFVDMKNHWAKAVVENLCREGIISGFPDGSFRPDDAVTRAEFAKMMATALELDLGTDCAFEDVPADSWYAEYVSAAANAELVKGYNGGFFPDDFITRQDAAVMIARAILYAGKELPASTLEFYDMGEISEYAYGAVAGLNQLNIVTGYDNLFSPQKSITRGESAALMERMLHYIKQ